MNIAAKSQKKCGQLQLPQANLHIKILDLVTNRINPYKEGLTLQNTECNTCINSSNKSPNRLSANKAKNQKKSTKKNIGLRTSYQTQPRTNATTHNNSFYDNPRPSLPFIQSPVLIKQVKRSLSLKSKVISISIDSTKLADITIDLRGQIQPQFVSSKFLCKLKLEIIEKQERIRQLQKELQLKEYDIGQLHKDIECLIGMDRKKSYSDNHLNNNEALSDLGPQPSSMKQVLIQRKSQKQKQIKQQNIEQQFLIMNDLEYLLRIIKTQANQLENIKNSDLFIKARQSLSKQN